MRYNDEYEDILPEEFSSLKDCVVYYGDVLSVIEKTRELGLYTKKEFKYIKKFIINHQNKSLKLIKKLDSHQRKEEENKLKPNKIKPKKETVPSLPPSTTKTINPKEQQYQIEDKKKSDKLDGQMDVEDLNKGDNDEKN